MCNYEEMIGRGLALCGLLVLRLIVGGWLTGSCGQNQQVRIAGKIDRVDQKGSNSIVVVGHFWMESEARIKFLRKQKVVVFGSCKREVIDFLLNRIWLVEPRIEIVDENTSAEIGWLMMGEGVRQKLVDRYREWLPEPEASLVAGIVLGAKSSLPERFYQALVNTGTVHIVVASGYNLTVVAEMMFLMLTYVMNRRWATICTVGSMMVYAWLTGWGVPIMRALVMGSLVLIAKTLGRTANVGWWLFLAVWAMVMVSPELIESISFQLSVMATAGLVWVEPWLRGGLEKLKIGLVAGILGTELVPTLSAQIATAPIIWWHFGRVSWISPLVNMLVLPLVPPLMLLGAVQLIGGWLTAPFVYSLLHLVVMIISWFDGLV